MVGDSNIVSSYIARNLEMIFDTIARILGRLPRFSHTSTTLFDLH